jgi:hypothetical protein
VSIVIGPMSVGPDFQSIANGQNCQFDETLHRKALGAWKTPDDSVFSCIAPHRNQASFTEGVAAVRDALLVRVEIVMAAKGIERGEDAAVSSPVRRADGWSPLRVAPGRSARTAVSDITSHGLAPCCDPSAGSHAHSMLVRALPRCQDDRAGPVNGSLLPRGARDERLCAMRH